MASLHLLAHILAGEPVPRSGRGLSPRSALRAPPNRPNASGARLADSPPPTCAAFCGARLCHSVPAGYDGPPIWSRANLQFGNREPYADLMSARTCLTIVLAAGEGTR